MKKATGTQEPRVYGYARISTAKQSIERQIRNISAEYPSALVRSEAYSGTTLARPVFDKLLRDVKPGDTIVFDSVSRMSRNADDGFALYERLFSEGVELVFIKEPHINTSVYREAMEKQISLSVNSGDADADAMFDAITKAINRYMLALAKRQIKIAFDQAQKEVDDLHARTREGIETVKRANAQAIAEGRFEDVKPVGKSVGDTWETAKSKTAKAIIVKHSRDFGGTLSDAEVITLAKISRNSFYKYKSELKQTQEA